MFIYFNMKLVKFYKAWFWSNLICRLKRNRGNIGKKYSAFEAHGETNCLYTFSIVDVYIFYIILVKLCVVWLWPNLICGVKRNGGSIASNFVELHLLTLDIMPVNMTYVPVSRTYYIWSHDVLTSDYYSCISRISHLW